MRSGVAMNLNVDKIMSSKVITVLKTDALEVGYMKLKSNAIRHLAVIDSENQVVGIISEQDFHRAMVSFEDSDYEFNEEEMIEDYMNPDLKFVSKDADLINVVEKMLDQQISAVLITDNNSLVGIMTQHDLNKILIELLRPQENVLVNVQNWIYKTPVGQIAEKLASIGI